MQYLKIPQARMPILIGKNGNTKKRIEERCGVKLIIDSKSGDVTIDDEAAAPLLRIKAGEVVKAIGRGFSPTKAFLLFDDDVYLKVFNIKDYVGKRPKRVREIRARVIGSTGKTRKLIERLTNAKLSVYGNTVSVIGELASLDTAATAVHMLLSGSEHSTVYKFLERGKRGAFTGI